MHSDCDSHYPIDKEVGCYHPNPAEQCAAAELNRYTYGDIMLRFSIILVFGLMPLQFAGAASLEKEVILTIDGVDYVYETSGQKHISINGQDVRVEIAFGDVKTFDDYGIFFQVPAETSAYLDQTEESFEIWNFDYYDSVFILMIFKDQTFEITEDILMRQLKNISGNMNMEVAAPALFEEHEGRIEGINAIGALGQYEFLIEQFGFSTDKHTFLVYTYSPMIDRETRNVREIYQNFRSTFFGNLTY